MTDPRNDALGGSPAQGDAAVDSESAFGRRLPPDIRHPAPPHARVRTPALGGAPQTRLTAAVGPVSP